MLMFADVDVCRSWNHTMDTDQNVVCESTRILVGSGFCLNKFTVTSYKTTINTTNTCTQKKKHLSPSTRRRNPQRMDQWKAKRVAVGDNTTCVQTQTADINPSTDETTQTDQHNSDAQAINIPTVLTKKGSDRHRQDAHILVRYQNQQNSTRTIQHSSIAFQSIQLLQILLIDHQHRKYVAGEDPTRRRHTCPQYLCRVDGRKTSTSLILKK